MLMFILLRVHTTCQLPLTVPWHLATIQELCTCKNIQHMLMVILQRVHTTCQLPLTVPWHLATIQELCTCKNIQHMLMVILQRVHTTCQLPLTVPWHLATIQELCTCKKASHGSYRKLLYDWRESCLLIGPICLHKSQCLPENWSKLANRVI